MSTIINIILVSYCGKLDTKECVDSILRCQDDINKNIIIVDNASPENQIDSTFSENYPFGNMEYDDDHIKINLGINNIYILQAPKNGGFGYGNNIGIKFVKKIGGDICLLLNNDTSVPSDFFIKLKDKFWTQEKKMAIGVKCLNYYSPLEIDNNGFGYLNLYTGKSSHRKLYKYKYIIGSCVALNNIDTLPYFNEHIFLYSEDVLYTYDLIKRGYEISNETNNFYYHKINSSTSKSLNIEKIKLQSLCYVENYIASKKELFVFYLLRLSYYLIRFQRNNLNIVWRSLKVKLKNIMLY